MRALFGFTIVFFLACAAAGAAPKSFYLKTGDGEKFLAFQVDVPEEMRVEEENNAWIQLKYAALETMLVVMDIPFSQECAEIIEHVKEEMKPARWRTKNDDCFVRTKPESRDGFSWITYLHLVPVPSCQCILGVGFSHKEDLESFYEQEVSTLLGSIRTNLDAFYVEDRSTPEDEPSDDAMPGDSDADALAETDAPTPVPSGLPFELESEDGTFEVYLDLPLDIEVKTEDNSLVFSFESFSDVVDHDGSEDVLGVRLGTAEWISDCVDELDDDETIAELDRTLLIRRSEILECIISTADNDESWRDDWRSTEWFFWHPGCGCFLSLYGTHPGEAAELFRYIAEPVVASLREAYSLHFADAPRASRMIADRDPSIPEGAVELGELQRQIGEAQRRTEEARETRDQLVESLRAKAARHAEARQPKIDPNGVSFRLGNTANRTMLVRFFNFGSPQSHPPKGVWPAAGKAYVLKPGETDDYDLACRKGESVCFGVEFQDEQGSSRQSFSYWGTALSGEEACEQCCGTCGEGSYAIDLTHDGRPPPPPVARRNDGGGQAVGAAIGIIGGMILNQQIQGGGQPAPRGPDWRPSGISK